MSKILVVIPYCAEGAQGDELQYAIAGWNKHFKEDFALVVVGDEARVRNGMWINCPRVQHPDDGNYLPHLDHAHKFQVALGMFPSVDGFIYACDDMYAVNDFTLEDVKALKYLEDDMGGHLLSPNGWDRDVAKTRNLCVANDLPVRNWVCHLPVYFDRKKFQVMYDRFDYANDSFVVEDVYFNLFHGDEPATKIDGTDRFRLGLNEPATPEQIATGMRDKIWITNSPLGWSDTLDRALKNYYGKI